MRIALLVAFAAGCHELPDLGVCGNGVIEADNGEACDGGIGCTEACVLACQPSALAGYVAVGIDPAGAEVFCPAAHACGVDNVCRAPSGKFAVVGEPEDFEVEHAAVGDFDGDRIDDLVGASTKLQVRLGSSSSPFSIALSQDAPDMRGAPVFFDRDPDTVTANKSDLAIAIPTEGLALLASDGEAFAPVIEGTFDLEAGNITRIVVADPDPALGDVVLAIARSPVTVKRIAIPPALAEAPLPGCGEDQAVFVATAVARDRRSFVVVARRMGNDAARWFACEYTVEPSGIVLTSTQVQGAPPTSVVLANLDADPCSELVTTTLGAVGFVDASDPDCVRATATTQVAGSLEADEVVLAAGAIVPGGRDELVLTSGLYAVANNALVRLPPLSIDRPWAAAAVTDLDGDGALDVVAGRRGVQDVDVVRGGGTPSVYPVDTIASVIAVVAGNFNNDPRGDVALVESRPNGDRVSILFGASDGEVGPVHPNSKFQGRLEIARLGRFTWGNPGRGDDGLDDLFVTLRIVDQPVRGGVLVGESNVPFTMPHIPPPPVTELGALAVGPLGVVAVRGTSATTSLVTTFTFATSEFATSTLDDFAADADPLEPAVLLRTANAPVIAVLASPAIRALSEGRACTGAPTGQGGMHAVDLEGDGLDELALIDTTGDRRVRVFAITGGPACAIGDEVLAAPLAECVDLVSAAGTLVAMCPRPGFVDLHRLRDGVREEEPFVKLGGVARQLLVGDFDGDGVPDLAAGLNFTGMGKVQLVRQCPAHDTRGCR